MEGMSRKHYIAVADGFVSAIVGLESIRFDAGSVESMANDLADTISGGTFDRERFVTYVVDRYGVLSGTYGAEGVSR